MINGCFGILAVIFCWGEILERCCTPYVQLIGESEEIDVVGDVELQDVELQVVSSENEIRANEAEKK